MDSDEYCLCKSSVVRENPPVNGLSDEFSGQRSVRVAISGIIAALYAVLVVVFAPFSFGPAQVRVADSMMPLALVFGYPAAAGLGIGCIVANFYGFATGATPTPVEVVGGSIANFFAAILAYKIYRALAARGRKGFVWVEVPILVENAVVTFIVGSYLSVLVPLSSDLIISATIWYYGLFIGSLITMNLLGYVLYKMTRIGIL